jgi:integrase
MESTLYFEQTVQPARAIALTELLELYFRYNPKISRSESYTIRQAFSLLLGMFPDDQPKPDTANFKVGYFAKFQRHLINLGYATIQINRLFYHVKRVFAWGGKPRFDLDTWDKLPPIVTSEFLVDMNAIDNIKDEGKKNPPRREVPAEIVMAVFPFVTETVADMLRLQLLTGMRPKELCSMHVCDIKKTRSEFSEYGQLFDGVNWIYVLPKHKTDKYIGSKTFPLGLQEQEILIKYMDRPLEAFLFWNSHGRPMTRICYDRNIKEAIEANNLKKFVPYQIRHTAISEISLEHGRDTARAVAGHTTEKMTARYDHSDLEKAFRVVRERNKKYISQPKVSGVSEGLTIPNFRIFTGE